MYEYFNHNNYYNITNKLNKAPIKMLVRIYMSFNVCAFYPFNFILETAFRVMIYLQSLKKFNFKRKIVKVDNLFLIKT